VEGPYRLSFPKNGANGLKRLKKTFLSDFFGGVNSFGALKNLKENEEKMEDTLGL
jgi:hypothetical protein